MDRNGKKEFIDKYKSRFSLIPLKTEPGKQKQPAIKEWQQYSNTLSDFPTERLMEGNVGIVTGPASGLLVIDADQLFLLDCYLQRNRYKLPHSYAVMTGKGIHHYLKYPDGPTIYGCKSLPLFGFDIRGTGGYVVAPYSIHEETGNTYELMSAGEIPEAPQWILDLYTSNTKTSAPNISASIKNDKIIELINSKIPVGERSESIMRVLDSLVAHGFNDDEIFYIFNTKPIGEKYQEKPDNVCNLWLQVQIDKAREYVSEPIIKQCLAPDDNEPTIQCISVSEFVKSEYEVNYLIDELLEHQGHTIITGRSNVGKSMFSLNLAFSLASATESGFLGHNIPKPVKVLIVQSENSEPFLKHRIQSLCKYDLSFSRCMNNVGLFYLDGTYDNQSFKFTNDNLNSVITRIHEDSSPDVIIFDPYSAYSGVQENDNDQNSRVIRRLYSILNEYGITSIIVHHEGKSSDYSGISRSRGASAIVDCVNNHWTLTERKDKDTGDRTVVLSCAKARNFKKFADKHLEVVNGVYFKLISNPYDPKKVVDAMYFNNGVYDTQSELIDVLVDQLGISKLKARKMVIEAVTKGYLIEEPYGRNKKRYVLPEIDAAA